MVNKWFKNGKSWLAMLIIIDIHRLMVDEQMANHGSSWWISAWFMMVNNGKSMAKICFCWSIMALRLISDAWFTRGL